MTPPPLNLKIIAIGRMIIQWITEIQRALAHAGIDGS